VQGAQVGQLFEEQRRIFGTLLADAAEQLAVNYDALGLAGVRPGG